MINLIDTTSDGRINFSVNREITDVKFTVMDDNFEGEILWDGSKPDGTPRKVLDISRIKASGWKPSISLEHGIASTINWYKAASANGKIRA